MHAIGTSELLTVWEQGYRQPPASQALALLAAAMPAAGSDVLTGMTIGRRDSWLMRLREQMFGTPIECLTECPACGERVELTFTTRDLAGPLDEPPAELWLSVAGYRLHARPATLGDLLDLPHDVAAAYACLLDRCIVGAEREGESIAPADLPPEVQLALAARLADADPLADIRFDLQCPACRHAWNAPFDIVTHFWTEIDAWAIRTLRDVHTLAAAYGWCEPDILALSPWRRQVYLQMVDGA